MAAAQKKMPDPYFVTWNKQVGAAQMAVVGAEVDEFILDDDRRVYDFVSTSFQASFGHSCEPIRRRIHDQLDRMAIASPKSTFELKERVSARLSRLLAIDGDAPGKIFYTVSGSESVENALKIARHWSGRPVVLARNRSYHGATLGAMSVSGDWRSAPHLNFNKGTVRIPEPDDDPEAISFSRVVGSTGPENIAAVIVESISGVNGVVIPPQSWWEGVARTCRETGILLICDEVLAGFGRTGPPFAFHHFGIAPDIVCMSKGITGGYVPFGAVWVAPHVAAKYDHEVLACGLTNYGHPLGLAALDAVLDLFGDGSFVTAKTELEKAFGDSLGALGEMTQVERIRHCGLLAAIEFRTRAPDWQSALVAGLYLVTREKSIILAPPFVSTPNRLRAAFSVLHGLI